MKRSPVNRRAIARAVRELDLEDLDVDAARAVAELEPLDLEDAQELAELRPPRRAA